MKRLFCISIAVWATAIPFSAAALAQATAFDGTYVGVSATYRGAMSGTGRGCPQFPAPKPLTISGGHARMEWSDSTLQGDVTPQGGLTLRAASTGNFTGQIAQGRITGAYAGHCNYDLVWQKR